MRIPAGVFSADGHGVLARRLRHDAEAARRQPLAGVNRLTVLRGDGHVDVPAVTLDVRHDFLAFRHNQRGRVGSIQRCKIKVEYHIGRCDDPIEGRLRLLGTQYKIIY